MSASSSVSEPWSQQRATSTHDTSSSHRRSNGTVGSTAGSPAPSREVWYAVTVTPAYRDRTGVRHGGRDHAGAARQPPVHAGLRDRRSDGGPRAVAVVVG